MASMPPDKLKKIQDMLNRIIKPKPPLQVDGLWGKKTSTAIKQMQSKAKVKTSGEVDAETALVIARVMKTGKIEKEQPKLFLTVNGKLVGYTQKEYDKLHKQIVSKLKMGPALKVAQNAGSAEAMWNHFSKHNKEQWFVSWCVEASRGADLPKKSLITNAVNASKKIEGYLKAGNLGKFHAEFPKVEKLANEAASKMYAYQKSMIEGAENWTMGLQFTKAASFTFLSVFGAPVAAGALGTGAVASAIVGGAAVATTQSAAGEIGNWSADKSGWTVGGAISNVLIDGGVGAVCGVFAKAGKGGKHLWEAGITRLYPK